VRRAALGALIVLLLAGCRVDTSVDVVVDDDGSGTVTVTVTLDEEAAARVPDLADQLEVRDLSRTGWEVTGPEPADGGGVALIARKAFGDPDQLADVLDDVGFVTGRLEREREFARTAYDFTGTLDLSAGLATFSDPELTELLGGVPVGYDPEALREEFGQSVRQMSSFSVSVSLPAGGDREVTTWEARLNDDPVELAAGTEERNLLALGLAGGAALVLFFLVVLLLVRAVRAARRR
jgi:hypothetical protein